MRLITAVQLWRMIINAVGLYSEKLMGFLDLRPTYMTESL
ncbi:hypothetical protein SDC9_113682 [bioreactor metagenome]|uniref:Uncharacterized protein n=1 Tax=bioreactor metagenome TaxID=1076179 RepID=A0A645BQB1_9ZZZZ